MRLGLSQKQFNSIIKRSQRLSPRQCCEGGVVSIRIYRAFYGPVGVRCECDKCGRYGEMQTITEFITSGERAGTPVTERSLIRGIRKAVRSWNK